MDTSALWRHRVPGERSCECSWENLFRRPVVLGQVTEKFREAVKCQAERQQIPDYISSTKETSKDDCRQRLFGGGAGCGTDRLCWCGAGEGEAFHGTKVNGQFQFNPRQDGLRQPLLLLHRRRGTSGRCF